MFVRAGTLNEIQKERRSSHSSQRVTSMKALSEKDTSELYDRLQRAAPTSKQGLFQRCDRISSHVQTRAGLGQRRKRDRIGGGEANRGTRTLFDDGIVESSASEIKAAAGSAPSTKSFKEIKKKTKKRRSERVV